MRILYGVAGEGMGHATRAAALLEHLGGHDVHIVVGGRAYGYLSKIHRAVHRISNFRIIYRNNRVDDLGMFLDAVLRLPFLIWSFLKVICRVLFDRPDVIVTDYEPFSCYAGLLLGVPVISFDNQHFVNRVRGIHGAAAEKTKIVNNLIIPSASWYIVTAFVSRPHGERTTLIPPVVRSLIARQKPTKGSHVLVYQTSATNAHLLRILRQLSQQFIIYGFDKDAQEGNISFKRFNERAFAKDLASCKALITNGGFTTISEALVLGKPILSEPVENQFEQMLNGTLLAEVGGKTVSRMTKEALQRFLARPPAVKKLPSDGAAQAVAVIERVFAKA